jgi:hypothetical protein
MSPMLRPTPTMARPIGVAAPAGSPRGAHPLSLPCGVSDLFAVSLDKTGANIPAGPRRKTNEINELNEILADGESA